MWSTDCEVLKILFDFKVLQHLCEIAVCVHVCIGTSVKDGGQRMLVRIYILASMPFLLPHLQKIRRFANKTRVHKGTRRWQQKAKSLWDLEILSPTADNWATNSNPSPSWKISSSLVSKSINTQSKRVSGLDNISTIEGGQWGVR